MYLESLRTKLKTFNEELERLEKEYSLSGDIDLKNKINELKIGITKLNYVIKRYELRLDYLNKKPISYHFVDDDGVSRDVMLGANDANYGEAYKQNINKLDDEKMEFTSMKPRINDEVSEDRSDVNIQKAKSSAESFAKDNLNYVVFRVNNTIHIVGDITPLEAYSNSDLVKKYSSDKNMIFKSHKENNLFLIIDGVKVRNLGGKFILDGDYDEAEFSDRSFDYSSNNSDDSSDEAHDDIKDSGDLGVINTPLNPPVQRMEVKRRSGKKEGLIKKFKKLSRGKKIAIIAGAIAVIGVGVFAMHMLSNTNSNPTASVNLINRTINNGIDVANNGIDVASNGIANKISGTMDLVKDRLTSFNTIEEGHTVFSTASDAASGINGVSATSDFRDTVVAVFDPINNKVIELTPDNIESVRGLLDDPSVPKAFGDSFTPGNVSGWEIGNGYKNIIDGACKVISGGRSL